MPTPTLDRPSELFRATVSRGLEKSSEERVDREGGKYNAGLIRGTSIISRGEAMGHGMWIDATMLSQVAEAINKSGGHGIKSRFAHPSLSGDGIGKTYAKAFNARVVGDQVFADLHMLESGHETPDGDLAGYVMDLAEEAPEVFGVSIVFRHDWAAEDEFEVQNQKEVETIDEDGKRAKRKVFRSPDPLNVENYRHVRMKSLRAADVVDSPAANPAGLFHAGEMFDVLQFGESVLDFAFGLKGDVPEALNGIDPTRIKGLVARWSEQRGVKLQKESEVSLSTSADPAAKPAEPTKETTQLSRDEIAKEMRAELGRYTTAFGAENGTKWFQEGITFTDAQAKHCEVLSAKNRDLEAKLAAAAGGLGEQTPLSGGSDQKDTKDAGTSLGDKTVGVLSDSLSRFAESLKVPSRN